MVIANTPMAFSISIQIPLFAKARGFKFSVYRFIVIDLEEKISKLHCLKLMLQPPQLRMGVITAPLCHISQGHSLLIPLVNVLPSTLLGEALVNPQ